MSCCPTNSRLHVIHAHSVWSVLDAAATVDEYINYVKENDLGFLALTEHGYTIGWYDLVEKCKKAGVKPGCGCEVYLMPRADTKYKDDKPIRFYHLTLIAKNEIGFRNLRDISSRAWGPDRVLSSFGNSKPRTTFEDLSLYNEGIICGSGCIEGPIAKHITRGEPEEAIKNANKLKDIFGDRLFIECMPHKVDHNFAEEVIEVEDAKGRKFTMALTDTVNTPAGRMTIKAAMEGNVLEISDPIPRRAGNPDMTEGHRVIASTSMFDEDIDSHIETKRIISSVPIHDDVELPEDES